MDQLELLDTQHAAAAPSQFTDRRRPHPAQPKHDDVVRFHFSIQLFWRPPVFVARVAQMRVAHLRSWVSVAAICGRKLRPSAALLTPIEQ